MHPSIWGKYFWAVLFLRAMVHPQMPTQEEVHDLDKFIRVVVDNLPCGGCRQHALEYVGNTPPLMHIANNDAAIRYLIDFKNSVNKRRGKEVLSYEKAIKEIGTTFFPPAPPKANTRNRKIIVVVICLLIFLVFGTVVYAVRRRRNNTLKFQVPK